MNIWKEMSKERIKPNDFVACIEIEQGSKNKYELDKETGMIMLDRVLYTSTHYPMNYGFIPRTYSEDNDPLDVFVLCSQPISQNCLVRCYPIGVVKMIDREENDEKIIAIPYGDPQWHDIQDLSELPHHIMNELKHFLEVYKQLENKKVVVQEIGDRKVAVQTIIESLERFNSKFEK